MGPVAARLPPGPAQPHRCPLTCREKWALSSGRGRPSGFSREGARSHLPASGVALGPDVHVRCAGLLPGPCSLPSPTEVRAKETGMAEALRNKDGAGGSRWFWNHLGLEAGTTVGRLGADSVERRAGRREPAVLRKLGMVPDGWSPGTSQEVPGGLERRFRSSWTPAPLLRARVTGPVLGHH